MLDQKDVQLIREMMEEVMDKRFAEQKVKLLGRNVRKIERVLEER